jgi:L-cysteine desulfidase
MNSVTPNNKHISPIHKKAIEILRLSSQISNYLVPDLARLQSDGIEDPNIYFTGDIVQQSNSLVPEIVQAESKTFSEERQQHILSISHLTNILDKNCERLERINSNGKEFLPILRNELKKFRKLQHIWMLTL